MKLNFTADKLNVVVAQNRIKMGESAASRVKGIIKELLAQKDEVRMVFAAAPSQNEFLNSFVNDKSIDWERIVAFHMDEYIGLPESSDKTFGKYLKDHLFSKVSFKSVHLINYLESDTFKECKRYEALLKEKPIDIVCMGIGENGHIAFNDPPVADFYDPYFIKIVSLDNKCRLQQVNDGCFNSMLEVPETAYTLTVPALMSASYLSIVVPGIRKADAVKNTLTSEIQTACPSTILRNHSNAFLFLDKESASYLN